MNLHQRRTPAASWLFLALLLAASFAVPYGLGIVAERAVLKSWRDYGFTSEQARNWWAQGVYLRSTAIAYRGKRIGPEEARNWLDADVRPGEAKDWKDGGVDVGTALEWSSSAFDPFKARGWREAGFTVVEAKAWRKYDFSPEEARKWRDSGLDPQTAYRERGR